ncbi:GAF and ANTAR domain-containing protein [Microlunatus spumicola]|uniref:GAF and ANTAR domain-containing protein n=1 Tax=Microlunatus spumicola TaxID=81499 RepID=A0ABP6XSS4_9ACTN
MGAGGDAGHHAVVTSTSPTDRSWGVSSSEVLTLVEGYLEDAATRTHERLGDVAGVAITTAVAGGDPLTVGSSTALAAEVDQVQYAIGVGPCLHALREGRETYVPDLARDPRWSPYGVEAAGLGVHTSLSVPVLDGRAQVVGVVKVYAGAVDGLDEEQRRHGRELALEVAGGVGLASTLVSTSLELDDRIEAMDTRRTIDLATGLIMGRLGCGPEAAFDLLRRESQNANLKLTDVAANLLARPAVPADGHGADGADGVDPELPRSVAQAPFRRRGEAPARGR